MRRTPNREGASGSLSTARYSFPQESIRPLTDGIEAARLAANFKATDSLKFADKTRPANTSKGTFRELKRRVTDLAAKHGVVFCAYAILHELAGNQPHKDLVEYGANTLLGKFNEFLGTDKDTFGLALFDRIPVDHPYRYLKEKFQVGLTFPDGKTQRLKRIVGLASTTDGASHLASVADILVGSFRYCVNEEDKDVAGQAMFPKLIELMWKRERGAELYVRGVGLVLRPQVVNEERFRKEYDALLARLQGYMDSRKLASMA